MGRLFKPVCVIALAFSLMAAQPAMADSFSIGYSTGGHGWNQGHRNSHHNQGRGWKHGHHKNHWRHDNHWGHHDRPRTTVFFSSYYPVVSQPVYYSQPIYLQPHQMMLGQQVAYNSGEFCREYQSLVTVGGLRQNSFGTACLQPDGSWRVVN